MNLITKISNYSGLSKGEIKIRLTGVIFLLAFFLFLGIISKAWTIPSLAALITIGGFVYGILRKD